MTRAMSSVLATGCALACGGVWGGGGGGGATWARCSLAESVVVVEGKY